MVNINIKEANGLILAYLGDSAWELSVRKYFINKGYNIRNLNKLVKSHVNAQVQSKYLKEIIGEFDEELQQIVHRARNSNIKTFPKSCTVFEYREATAFEALIGALYVMQEFDRIDEIAKRMIEKEW